MKIAQTLIIFFMVAFLMMGSILFFTINFLSLRFLLVYYCFVGATGYLSMSFLSLFRKKIPKNDIIYSSNTIAHEKNPALFSARSVFLLDLFPDQYIVHEKTLTIIRHKFFFNSWAETVPIENIDSVRIYAGPLFASLTINKKEHPSKLYRAS